MPVSRGSIEYSCTPTMPQTTSFRVVTFNAWVLPVRVPSQQRQRRLRQLPQALAALDADVFVLQEMFDARARRRIVQALAPSYQTTPNATASRRSLGLLRMDETGGLLVLSRWPIIRHRFFPHPRRVGRKPDERIGRKGAMIFHVDTRSGPVTFLTLHLYAGTKPRDSRVRLAQLGPLLEILEAEASGAPVVFAGDVNTSPTVRYPEPPGPDNPLTPEYAALLAAGFVDPVPHDPGSAIRLATWVPSRNRYAALPYQETKTDERYDYVLVRSGAGLRWEVKDTRTVIDGANEHLSDHVGVLADLDLVPDA